MTPNSASFCCYHLLGLIDALFKAEEENKLCDFLWIEPGNGEVGKISWLAKCYPKDLGDGPHLVNDCECDFGLTRVLPSKELFSNPYEGRLCGSFSSFNRQPQSFDASL
jgi:hypothetical protein